MEGQGLDQSAVLCLKGSSHSPSSLLSVCSYRVPEGCSLALELALYELCILEMQRSCRFFGDRPTQFDNDFHASPLAPKVVKDPWSRFLLLIRFAGLDHLYTLLDYALACPFQPRPV